MNIPGVRVGQRDLKRTADSQGKFSGGAQAWRRDLGIIGINNFRPPIVGFSALQVPRFERLLLSHMNLSTASVPPSQSSERAKRFFSRHGGDTWWSTNQGVLPEKLGSGRSVAEVC
jgi:hypothetical protein